MCRDRIDLNNCNEPKQTDRTLKHTAVERTVLPGTLRLVGAAQTGRSHSVPCQVNRDPTQRRLEACP